MTADLHARAFRLTGLRAIDEALDTAPLAAWEELRDSDPCATFFQSRTWTVCWYRAYREQFAPLLVVLHRERDLLGLAALAVETRTRRLAFAGDHMADYRDVIARPGHREAVLREVVRIYREGGYAGALRVGSTLPESPSVDLVIKVSREQGVPALRSSHSGWRWWLEKSGDPFKSRSARYKRNCLQRRGEVALSRIDRMDDWVACRDEFYDHHSLRQIYRGTVVSFDKPEKQAFVDALLQTPAAHVTVLRAGGSAVAWHYGFLDRGLLYWGAPAFDVREHRHSPSLILMLLIMQRAGEWGIRGLDLAIGQGELKERNSTDHVALPTAHLFPTRRAWLPPRAMQVAVSATRRVFAALGREDTWTRRVRPFLHEALVQLREASAMRPWQAWRHLQATFLRPLGWFGRTVAFAASAPEPWTPALPASPAPPAEFHVNQLRDLLRFPEPDRYALSRVRSATVALAEGGAADASLHTMVTGGRLSAWVFARTPSHPTPSGIDGLTIPPGATILSGAEVIDGSTRALTALIRHVADGCRAAGASQVWLLVDSPPRRIRRAIEAAGFHLERRNPSRWRRSARPREAVA